MQSLLVHQVIDGFDVFIPQHERRPWELAADDFAYWSPIVVPDEWVNVFRKGANPFTQPLSVFVGPKGVGKSSLLTLKRALIEGRVVGFDGGVNAVCLPEDRLTFRSSPGAAMPIRANTVGAATFSELEPWVELWRLLLAGFVLQAESDRRSKAEQLGQQNASVSSTTASRMPKRLLELFSAQHGRLQSGALCELLSAAVNSSVRASELNALYREEVRPLLQSEVGPRRYCLFVDAVDEQLRDETGAMVDAIQHQWIKSDAQKSSYNIWANAQAGLCLAVMDIASDTNRNVRVYTTIRSEAIFAAADRLSEQQLRTTCGHISYSQKKLETIVRLNIAIDVESSGRGKHFDDHGLTSMDRLNSAVDVFFNGATTYRAYEKFPRTWTSEVVRYSMERPRELMEIGAALSSKMSSEATAGGLAPESNYVQLIEGTLGAILRSFLKFTVGEQVAREFSEKVFPHIPASVLNREQLEQIEQAAIASGCAFDHPLCKLYSLGLLGSIKHVLQTGLSIQEFSFGRPVNYSLGPLQLSLPSSSETFVVHPVLSVPIADGTYPYRSQRSPTPRLKRLESCPIGNELPWVERPSGQRQYSYGVEFAFHPAPSRLKVNEDVVAGFLGKVATRRAGNSAGREKRVIRAGTLPYYFLLAWISAVDALKSSDLSGKQLSDHFASLVEAGYFPRRISGTMNSKLSKEVFKTLCENLDPTNDVVTDIAKFLRKQGQLDPITVRAGANLDKVRVSSNTVLPENVIEVVRPKAPSQQSN